MTLLSRAERPGASPARIVLLMGCEPRPAILVGMLILAGWARAGQASGRASTPGKRPDPDRAPVRKLSLSDCVSMGVQRNLGLAASRLSKDEAELGIPVARRILVPQAASSVRRELNRGEDLVYDATVSETGLDGTSYGLRLEGRDATDGSQASPSMVSIFLTRPLLRNFGRHITGLPIDLSQIDAEIAVWAFRGSLNLLIFNIVEAVLDLMFAQENLAIQEQAYARAKRQYEETQAEIARGVLAGQDIFVVEENLVRFEIRRLDARRDIAFHELSLGALLNLPAVLAAGLRIDHALRSDLADLAGYEKTLGTLLELNPAYNIRRLTLGQSRANLRFFENQVRPLVDIFLDHRINHALREAQDAETTVGLSFQVPLDRAPVRARARQSAVKVQGDVVSIEGERVRLSYDLKKVYLDLENQARILKLREKATVLSQQKLDAQISKYKNGISTLIDVVRFQQDLQNTMIDETSTRIAFNKLLFRRLFLEGSLYRAFGIVIDRA
jgi:outer membrane protein TolC